MEHSYSIEIKGEIVALKHDDVVIKETSLKDFTEQIVELSDRSLCPDPLPDGVRFVRRIGRSVTLVVVEVRPQYRRVRWIKESSKILYGPGATYHDVRLAFPYIILFILFADGQMTGYQQVFYRTAPLTSQHDALLLTNLRNCTYGNGVSWICLSHLNDIETMSHLQWDQKINRVVEYLWARAFNKSAEGTNQKSYWTTMRKIDDRVSSIEAWERASKEDPSFPLKIDWKPSGLTVKDAIEKMVDFASAYTMGRSINLLDIVNRCPPVVS